MFEEKEKVSERSLIVNTYRMSTFISRIFGFGQTSSLPSSSDLKSDSKPDSKPEEQFSFISDQDYFQTLQHLSRQLEPFKNEINGAWDDLLKLRKKTAILKFKITHQAEGQIFPSAAIAISKLLVSSLLLPLA